MSANTTPISYRQLIWNVNSTLRERMRRLRTLSASSILPSGELDISNTTHTAIELLREKPEHILEWLSEEELALYVKLEEE